MSFPEHIKERFLSRIVKLPQHGGCWIYLGRPNRQGYGTFGYNHQQYYAHRASYIMHKGPIPEDKPYICHACDVPTCVNPDHLWAGTQSDNMQDCADKGRNSRLSHVDAKAIRARITTGEPYTILAKEYGVSIGTLSNIKTGKTFRIAGMELTRPGRGTPQRKITDAMAKEMITARKSGITVKALAAKHKLCRTTIQKFFRGDSLFSRILLEQYS